MNSRNEKFISFKNGLPINFEIDLSLNNNFKIVCNGFHLFPKRVFTFTISEERIYDLTKSSGIVLNPKEFFDFCVLKCKESKYFADLNNDYLKIIFKLRSNEPSRKTLIIIDFSPSCFSQPGSMTPQSSTKLETKSSSKLKPFQTVEISFPFENKNDMIMISNCAFVESNKLKLNKNKNYRAIFWIRRNQLQDSPDNKIIPIFCEYDKNEKMLPGQTGNKFHYYCETLTLPINDWVKIDNIIESSRHNAEAEFISAGSLVNYSTGKDLYIISGIEFFEIVE